MIHVAVFDERPIFLLGLEQAIRKDPGMVLVASAPRRADFLSNLEHHACGLAVVGVSHPEQVGMAILKDIAAKYPGVGVLALCMFPWQELTVAVIRAGASGCLADDSPLEEVLTAIRSVAHGQPYFAPSTSATLVTALRGLESAAEPTLSQRQRQVLRLYAGGKTITEIAGITGLSVRTVSTYKARILQKLQLSSNAELIAYAIRNSFL